MMSTPARRKRGFTLIELMVALAIVAVILTIAAPSFRGVIEMKRLRGIQSQVVTDMQFARSEAVTRNTYLRVVFNANADMTCYTLFTSTDIRKRCNCLEATPALRCPGLSGVLTEVRTVQVPTSLGVTVTSSAPDPAFAYDHLSGGLVTIPTDVFGDPLPSFVIHAALDPARRIDTVLNQAGRPTVCTPAGSTTGEAACAP